MISRRSPRATRIDPTQFMLSSADRKFSAPVFSALYQPEDVEAQHISRSAEVDNIPEEVQGAREEQLRRIRSVGQNVAIDQVKAVNRCKAGEVKSWATY